MSKERWDSTSDENWNAKRASFGFPGLDELTFKVLLAPMASDQTITKVEFSREGDRLWRLSIETIDGVDARGKVLFYWDEFNCREKP